MCKLNIFPVCYFFLAIWFAFSGCVADVEIPGSGMQNSYAKVYMPQAVTLPVECAVTFADTTYGFVFGAAVGGFGELENNLVVSFKTDTSLITVYNNTYGTNYLLLPDSSFFMSDTVATIAAGMRNSNILKLQIKPIKGLRLDKQYLLPLCIKSLKGKGAINEYLRTAYFHFVVKPLFYNRSLWSIASVSSESAAEGDYGNFAIYAIDGKPNTWWRSKWALGQITLPHYIAVNMHNDLIINGFRFTPRPERLTSGGNPENIVVQLSNDGVNWVRDGQYVLENTDAKQLIYLKAPKKAAYFKIEIMSSFVNVRFTNIAEIEAF